MTLLRRRALMGSAEAIDFNGVLAGSLQNSLQKSGTGDESDSLRSANITEYDADNLAMTYVARSGTKKEGVKWAKAPKNDDNNWTKQNADGQFVIQSAVAGWDISIGGATSIKIGSTWYHYYDSDSDLSGGKIGIASGATFESPTKSGNNPIIDNTGTPGENRYLRHPAAIVKNSTIYLFVDARPDGVKKLPHQIGLYTAPTSNPENLSYQGLVVDAANFTSSWFTDAAAPYVFEISGKYFMFFNGGIRTDNILAGAKPCLATSTDLTTWTMVSEKLPFAAVYESNVRQSLGESTVHLSTDGNYYLTGNKLISGSTGFGRIQLTQGVFDDTFPTPLLEHTFDGTTIDTNIWNPDADGGGITITQNNKLILDADGSQNTAAKVTRSVSSFNENLLCLIFDGTRTVASATNHRHAGLADSGNTNYAAIEIPTNTEVRASTDSDSESRQTKDVTLDYSSKRYKIVVDGGSCRWHYWDGTKWEFLWHVDSDVSLTNLFVSLEITNTSGVPIQATIDNVLVLNYDPGVEDPTA